MIVNLNGRKANVYGSTSSGLSVTHYVKSLQAWSRPHTLDRPGVLFNGNPVYKWCLTRGPNTQMDPPEMSTVLYFQIVQGGQVLSLNLNDGERERSEAGRILAINEEPRP